MAETGFRVAVIRHGERASGVTDPPLTPAGRRMAEEAGRWLREQGFSPTILLHSPTRRTRETADEICILFPALPRAPLPSLLEDEREWAELMLDPRMSGAVIVGHHPLIVALQGRYGPPPVPVPVHHYASVLLLEALPKTLPNILPGALPEGGPLWAISAAWPGRSG